MRGISDHLFFVVGNDTNQGKILQRFPQTDWPDTPFIEGMELVSCEYATGCCSNDLHSGFVLVLPAARMGAVFATRGTEIFHVGSYECRRKSLLLCRALVQ